MATIVVFAENETPQRVIGRPRKSVETSEYFGRTDVVIFDNSNPLSILDSLKASEPNPLYWKHDNGAISVMTQGEKDALDLALATEHTNKYRQSAKALLNKPQGQLTKAVALALLDAINEIRTELKLPKRTQSQLFNAVRAKIDAGDVD